MSLGHQLCQNVLKVHFHACNTSTQQENILTVFLRDIRKLPGPSCHALEMRRQLEQGHLKLTFMQCLSGQYDSCLQGRMSSKQVNIVVAIYHYIRDIWTSF